jgi:heme exporter protein D
LSFDSSFWVGAALAIPLGLATNLVTPAVQKRLAQRSERADAQRRLKLQSEQDLVDQLSTNAIAYQNFLLSSLTRILLYIAALFLAGNVIVVANLVPSEASFSIASLITIIAISAVFVLISNTVRQIRRITHGVAKRLESPVRADPPVGSRRVKRPRNRIEPNRTT